MSGLAAYLDLVEAARLGESLRRHMGVREGTQGWTDATLIETHKRQARYCYSKYKAYQPLTSCWHEADLVVHSEFRDGNVNAGYEQLRVLKELLEQLPVPTMQMGDGRWYKVTGVVTNRELPGDELIRWYRQRCGKGEEVHSVLKEDLAGGRLPSGKFGANAAWWAIVVLAFNLNSAMKRLVLGGDWVSRRLKAVRFGVICIAGRVVRHARRLIIRLTKGHPSYELLLRARGTISAPATAPT